MFSINIQLNSLTLKKNPQIVASKPYIDALIVENCINKIYSKLLPSMNKFLHC